MDWDSLIDDIQPAVAPAAKPTTSQPTTRIVLDDVFSVAVTDTVTPVAAVPVQQHVVLHHASGSAAQSWISSSTSTTSQQYEAPIDDILCSCIADAVTLTFSDDMALDTFGWERRYNGVLLCSRIHICCAVIHGDVCHDGDDGDVTVPLCEQYWCPDVVTLCPATYIRIMPFDFSTPSPDDLCLAAQSDNVIIKLTQGVSDMRLQWLQMTTEGTAYTLTVQEMLDETDKKIAARIMERAERAQASGVHRATRDDELTKLKEQREGVISSRSQSERRQFVQSKVRHDRGRARQRDKKQTRMGM